VEPKSEDQARKRHRAKRFALAPISWWLAGLFGRPLIREQPPKRSVDEIAAAK